MKHKSLILALAAMALLPTAMTARTTDASTVQQMAAEYQSIGPAVAASATLAELPRTAKDFIRHNYQSVAIVDCTKDFSPLTYEVDLADGTDIEFNRSGDWIEVDAPDNGTIPYDVVSRILPDRATRELSKKDYMTNVTSVKKIGKTYEVEFNIDGQEDMLFSHDGKLISMY